MRLWTVDAFVARPADAWMQDLAAENSQAETAFLPAAANTPTSGETSGAGSVIRRPCPS